VTKIWQQLKNARLSIAYGLVLLPNINPLKFILGAEVFPWASLVSVSKRTAPSIFYLLFLGYIASSGFFAISQGLGLISVARSAVAFVNATLVFFYISNISTEQREKLMNVILVVLGLNTAVSLLQLWGLFPLALEAPMQLLIERFEAESYSQYGGRGVAGLFAEPSYAGMAVQYMMAFLFYAKRISFESVLGRLLVLGVFLFQLLVVRSATSLVVFVFFFLAIQPPGKLLKSLLLFLLAMVVLSLFVFLVPNPPRSLDVLSIFFKSFINRDPGHLPMNVLMNESGFRIIGTWGTYWYGLVHPLGCGVGNWGDGSIEAMELLGYPASELDYFITYYGGDFEGVRPTAFLAGIFLELGVVGFLFWLGAFFKYATYKPMWTNVHLKPIAVLFLSNVFIVGTIGDPIPFVFLALAYSESLNANSPCT
jgi:hypothetical protein